MKNIKYICFRKVHKITHPTCLPFSFSSTLRKQLLSLLCACFHALKKRKNSSQFVQLISCTFLSFYLSCFVQAAEEEDFFELSFEELATTSISGIARKEQDSFNSTSASYVITQEEIRRSGMTTIPDLLRMVPGMHIGQQNTNIWAIDARSPNRRLSREILVMIDGRSVYNPLFNGVYWNRIDTLLEDIERIEIIRGPGSSLWGANASNGIINIVTKKANDSQGLLLNASGGTAQFNNEFSGRYGFAGENYDAKFYLKKTKTMGGVYPIADVDEQPQVDFPVGDHDFGGQQFIQTGFRTEFFLPSSDDEITLQGDYYQGEEKEMRIPRRKNHIDTRGYNLLARYQHEINEDSSAVLQFYFDLVKTNDSAFNNSIKTYDIDFYHNFDLSNQSFVWGFGLRRIMNQTKNSDFMGGLGLSPEDRTTNTFSFFIEDEMSLIEDTLSLTIGSKFEKNDYTDYEFQPNIKLGYQYNKDTFFWGSLGKAIAIPSRIEADGFVDFSQFRRCPPRGGFTDDPILGCIIDVSTPNLKASILYTAELGHRQKLTKKLSIDNSIFFNDYHVKRRSRLIYQVYGYEGIMDYKATSDWKLKATFSYHQGRDNDDDNMNQIAFIPQKTASFYSYYNLNEQMDIDLSYYYASHTKRQKKAHRVDLRFAYRPIKSLELSLTGTNLLDPQHVEGNIDPRRTSVNIGRALIGKIRYQFE